MKQFRFPFWENYQKDRITCKLVTQNDRGEETSSTCTIHKYNANGSVNPDFDLVIEQNGIEKIDSNTKEREDRHKRRREDEQRRDKERKQALKLEKLFNAKLEVFEEDIIKNSKNRKLKAKIRKSKSYYEMLAHTMSLIQYETEEKNDEQK